eukprot:Rhum_TRINITY_DN14997_c8_g2::Rhum_TRINITY_DN14997_c8_g2_i1::g.131582::m.131582
MARVRRMGAGVKRRGECGTRSVRSEGGQDAVAERIRWRQDDGQNRPRKEGGFPCPYCSEVLETALQLRRHVSAHTWPCAKCGVVIRKHGDVKAHQEMHERLQRKQNMALTPTADGTPQTTDPRPDPATDAPPHTPVGAAPCFWS